MAKLAILMSEVPDPEEIEENTRLAEVQSKVFVMKFHKKMTAPEIAEELGVTKGAVDKSVGRIREKREIAQNTVEIFDEVEDK